RAPRLLLSRRRRLGSNLTPPKRTWLNNKLLLLTKPAIHQRHGKRTNLGMIPRPRLLVSRQKSRRSNPGFATLSRGRNSFRSWRRRLKTWNGKRRWTKQITNISQHRWKKHG